MGETQAEDRESRGAEIIRHGFGDQETRAVTETASSAVAAQAQAQVQARYVVAMQRPRDWDVVRDKLLRDCRRSSFADVAIYNKPVGNGVEGPSIRFAEAAMRAMTNIMPDVSTIYDDDKKRILRVSVTDLEANLTYSKDVVVTKTIERRSCPQGVTPLGSRFNAQGKKLYILEATDDDILNRENALISKAIRTSGLRLLPGDILDECIATIKRTQRAATDADPDAARRRVLDGLSSIGIPPDQVKAYLGHDIATASPAEIDHLRALFSAIRDGEATWAEAMDSKAPAQGDGAEKQRQAAQDALRKKLEGRRRPPKNDPEGGSGCDEKPSGNGGVPPSGSKLDPALSSAIQRKLAGYTADAQLGAEAALMEELREQHGEPEKLRAKELAAAIAHVQQFTYRG